MTVRWYQRFKREREKKLEKHHETISMWCLLAKRYTSRSGPFSSNAICPFEKFSILHSQLFISTVLFSVSIRHNHSHGSSEKVHIHSRTFKSHLRRNFWSTFIYVPWRIHTHTLPTKRRRIELDLTGEKTNMRCCLGPFSSWSFRSNFSRSFHAIAQLKSIEEKKENFR